MDPVVPKRKDGEGMKQWDDSCELCSDSYSSDSPALNSLPINPLPLSPSPPTAAVDVGFEISDSLTGVQRVVEYVVDKPIVMQR
jgi:hypothetical protein